MTTVLDNPAWASLAGPHAHLAERVGAAARYPADVGPHHAIADPADPRAWADLATLIGPGATIMLGGAGITAPPGWQHGSSIGGVQMVGVAAEGAPDPEAVRLGTADVPEMLDLVARTRPGPFRTRTIAFGAYLGLRDRGRLVAMAGERLHPPGWTEVSAVCTDPAYRGRGLATRLIRAVIAGIRERGEVPFLHASATNDTAIRLYESLGFTLRIRTTFNQLTSPAVREAARIPGA